MKALVITVMIILFLFAVEFIACAIVSLVKQNPNDKTDGDRTVNS